MKFNYSLNIYKNHGSTLSLFILETLLRRLVLNMFMTGDGDVQRKKKSRHLVPAVELARPLLGLRAGSATDCIGFGS